MNKNAVKAFLTAGILFAVYVAVVFLIPFERNGVFWLSFLFAAVALGVCCLALNVGMLQKKDAKSKFYGFSVVRVGLYYAAAQAVLSLVFMALAEHVELWIPGLMYLVAFGIAIIGVISVEAVVEQIQRQDEKLKRNVTVMRSLQSKLNRMVSLCPDVQTEKLVRDLSEEVRYSDPVSSEPPAFGSWDHSSVIDELQTEADLVAAVEDLQQALADGSPEDIRMLCRKASALLAERNRLCKLNKG